MSTVTAQAGATAAGDAPLPSGLAVEQPSQPPTEDRGDANVGTGVVSFIAAHAALEMPGVMTSEPLLARVLHRSRGAVGCQCRRRGRSCPHRVEGDVHLPSPYLISGRRPTRCARSCVSWSVLHRPASARSIRDDGFLPAPRPQGPSRIGAMRITARIIPAILALVLVGAGVRAVIETVLARVGRKPLVVRHP